MKLYLVKLTKTSGSSAIPTPGINLSGRTVTGFAYNNTANPKTLSVTLV